jgi:hypothetical protein
MLKFRIVKKWYKIPTDKFSILQKSLTDYKFLSFSSSKDGTPCCVSRPECETNEECQESMGKSMCLDGTCHCAAPLFMNKKRQCVSSLDKGKF